MASSGDRIRALRDRAGLTQAELAQRTGIAQPKLSDYERGVVVPSPSSFDRIVRAARRRPSEVLEEHADEVLILAAKYNLRRVRVFGSAVYGTDTPDSDIDLLVTPESSTSLFDLSGFANATEELLGYPVDVISDTAGRGIILDRARAEAIPL
ncbi:hypothetical protein BH09ACT1_BH09ACT1_11810 [soil metagenome]